MGGVRRLLLQRLDDHPLDVFIGDLPRLAGTRLVVQAIDAPLGKATSPLANRRSIAPQLGRDLLTLLTVGRSQHDSASQGEGLCALRAPSPPLQHLSLLVAENDLCTNGHDASNRRLRWRRLRRQRRSACELMTQVTRSKSTPRGVGCRVEAGRIRTGRSPD